MEKYFDISKRNLVIANTFCQSLGPTLNRGYMTVRRALYNALKLDNGELTDTSRICFVLFYFVSILNRFRDLVEN